MPSWKHEILKGVLNTLSWPMHWALPPITHLRSILETSTMLSTLPWGVHFRKITFDNFAAEYIEPDKVLGDRVILYLHGGGYVIGSPHSHRALAGKIAKGANSICLLIDYRKAPEHPFPAALEDALFSYKYLLLQGYKASDIILAGDSAGGGLAIALQLKLKEEKLPLPLASVLLSPYLDLANTGRSIKKNARNDRFLDIFEMRRWAALYAGDNDYKNPFISPLYGDLNGLSPILIQASESEVLFDDSSRFVKKCKNQEVDITFQTWHGLIHWWHMFGTMPEAKEAIEKIILFVNERFSQR